jgi:hypothetical protein
MLVTSISAQPGIIIYGNGCGDLHMSMVGIGTNKGYKLNDTVTVQLTYSIIVDQRKVWVFVGFDKANYLFFPSRWGCRFLVEPIYVFPTFVFNSYKSLPLFKIPNDPLLVGLPLYFQALSHDSFYWEASDAIQLKIGK